VARRFLIKNTSVPQPQDRQDPLGVPGDAATNARNASDFYAAIAAPEAQSPSTRRKVRCPYAPTSI
jgi:hypothetical protein